MGTANARAAGGRHVLARISAPRTTPRLGLGMPGESPVTRLPLFRIMSRNLMSVDVETSLCQIRDLFGQLPIRHLMVVDAGRAIGVISGSDLLRRGIGPNRPGHADAGPGGLVELLRARDLMQVRLVHAHQDCTLREAAKILWDSGSHSLPVVDDRNRPVGLVTTTDLIRVLTRHR